MAAERTPGSAGQVRPGPGRYGARLWICLLLGLVIAAGCQRQSAAPPAQPDPRSLRLGLAEQPSTALVLAAPGLYGQRELLVSSDRLVRERPDALRRVLAALLDAQAFCEADPAAAQSLVARELGVPVTRIEALWPEVRLRVRLDQSLLVLLEDQARWYLSAGLVPERLMPNYLALIEPGPLQALAPASVTLLH